LKKTRAESEDRAKKIYMLVDRVRAMQKEQGLLQDALDSTKASALAQQEEAEARYRDYDDRVADLERHLEEEKQRAVDLEAEQAAAKEMAKEFDKFQTRAAADAEEAAADSASIRQRLNEAIQERYRVQAELDRIHAESDKKSAGVSLQDFAEKERQFKRRIQDLEGEVKRAKMDKGSSDTKQRLATALEETAKLQTVTKKLAAQIAELEEDLSLSEAACDEYEQLIQTLRDAKH
jgi:chromosome segregation ATPase